MENIVNFVFVMLITAGAVLAVHGTLILRGKRRPKVLGLEKQILTVLSPPEVDEMRKTLGRLRIMYGAFLILIAVWALLQ